MQGGGRVEAAEWLDGVPVDEEPSSESPEHGEDDGPRESVGVVLEDFYAYMPQRGFIFVPTRELWPAASVDARVRHVRDGDEALAASVWLSRHQAVEQMTWAPGEPLLIEGRLIDQQGGWIERPGCRTFNLYRPPTPQPGDPTKAAPWREHLAHIYSQDAEHVKRYLAHRVQRPGEKINHALVLGGLQGIGKDTLLEPVKHGIGPWNFVEVTPGHLLGRFNGFVKAVVLRVSEARDLGEVNRYSFYDHMKAYTAAPPDVLRCDEKNVKEYAVLNVCAVITTTNHKDGLYLPPDDRRHYVAWSEATKEDFPPEY